MRKYFRLSDFQLRVIYWNIFMVMIIFVIVLILMAVAVRRLNQKGIEAGYSAGHSYFSFVDEMSRTFYVHLSIAFIIGLFFSAIFTYFAVRHYSMNQIGTKAKSQLER